MMAACEDLRLWRHKAGPQKFQPLGQPGGDGFVAGHCEATDGHLLVKLRRGRGPALMTARRLFVKQAEADRDPIGNIRRRVMFETPAVSGQHAAQLSQLVQLGQKSLIDSERVRFSGTERGELAQDPVESS